MRPVWNHTELYTLHGNKGYVLFGNEEDAETFVFDSLSPYCTPPGVIQRQVSTAQYRFDIGFRLTQLPAIPIVVEIKAFNKKFFPTFSDAVAQASDYASRMGTVSLVSPLINEPNGKSTWFESPIGAALIIAYRFNVGGLFFNKNLELSSVVLADQEVISFNRDRSITVHVSNIDSWFRCRSGKGSTSSRWIGS